MVHRISKGDRVRQGDGPVMTVSEVFSGSSVICVWREEGNNQEDLYDPELLDKVTDEEDSGSYVCVLCKKPCVARTSHWHGALGGWVGDECCWDERLRMTE